MRKQKGSWKENLTNIFKPNIIKIMLTIVLLLLLPIYPCKNIVLCESISGSNCNQDLGMKFFTLNKVVMLSDPICIYSLIYFPVILFLVYAIISIVVFIIKKNDKI